MKRYYEIAVDGRELQGQDTLTYSSDISLSIGSLVRIPLRSKKLNGVVISQTRKPTYTTKPIVEIIEPAALNQQQITLARWLSEYYSASLSSVIQLFIPRGAHKNRRQTSQSQTGEQPRPRTQHKLTAEQAAAVGELSQNSQTALLHGVTGSGKTRIYLEMAKKTHNRSQGVIILVPEIGLTAQIVADFKSQFGKVFVLHSQQSESFRHQQWSAILQHPNPIVIGPRSALFSPVNNLGLIVVDEEHETAYKQDQNPRYHTVRVAAQYAKITGAKLILGSATPRIDDYYLALRSHSAIIRLDKPIMDHMYSTKRVIVDLRQRENFGDSSILSKILIKTITSTLNSSHQVLLFHNRRGTSTSVICTNCGWLAQCPRCQMPLTHHADWNQLVCHVCNFRQAIVTSCPACHHTSLLYKGIGTKHIVNEVERLFPETRVARFDSDNVTSERLNQRYRDIHEGKFDILVGTQMIAKGIDLPKLRTVGVVQADTELHIPDFASNERSFQLLYQVIGRVGRHQNGTAIIQTYSPEHPALKAAVERNYQAFLQNELAERKLTGYPPFSHLLLLWCERKTRGGAQSAANRLVEEVASYKGIKILGPSPAFHEKLNNLYHWHVVVKAKQRAALLRIVEHLPTGWKYDIDPVNLM